MQTVSMTLPETDQPALSRLFKLYVSGRIDETPWKQLMQVLDASEATGHEREALAGFFADAVTELEPNMLKLPRAEEASEFLTLMRAN